MAELDILYDKLSSLATKEDIKLLFDCLKKEVIDDFENRLLVRDERIHELEMNNTLLESRLKTLESSYNKDFNALEKRISSMEYSYDNDTLREIDIPAIPLFDPASVPSGEPKKEVDVLLVGTSIIRHVDLADISNSNEKLCIPGADVSKVRFGLKEKLRDSTHYKKIIIECGVNDIPKNRPSKVAQDILSLIKSVKTSSPDSQITVNAVLPKISTSYLKSIDKINRRLYNLQDEIGYTLVMHPQFACNGLINNSLFAFNEVKFGRPVHLSRKGFSVYGSNIKYSSK